MDKPITNRERAIAFGEVIPQICAAFEVTRSTILHVQATWFQAVERGDFGDESDAQ